MVALTPAVEGVLDGIRRTPVYSDNQHENSHCLT